MNVYVLMIFLVVSSGITILSYIVQYCINVYHPQRNHSQHNHQHNQNNHNQHNDNQHNLYRIDVILHGLIILRSVSLWYSISIAFTMYNKWLLSDYQHGSFHYPLAMTSMHLIVKYGICKVWFIGRGVWANIKRYYFGNGNNSGAYSRIDSGNSSNSNKISMDTSDDDDLKIVPPLSSWYALVVSILIGIATAGDIALSNEGAMMVSVTLYTTVKSAVLVCTYLWAVLLGLEQCSLGLCCAVILISFGVGLSVFATTNVSLVGILCVLGASMFAGLRWALMQMLLVVDGPSASNSVIALLRFAPYSALSILPVGYLLEDESFYESAFFTNAALFRNSLLMSIAGGVIAFVLMLVEINLIRQVSSVTMGVFGQLKEIIQIGLSMLIFKDKMSINAAIGLSLALCGVNWYRSLKVSADHPAENVSTMRVLTTENESFGVDGTNVDILTHDVDSQVEEAHDHHDIEMSDLAHLLPKATDQA